MIKLVFDTIREPMRIVNVPVAIGKLLAAPRERFFKSVRSLSIHPEHSTVSLQCCADEPKAGSLIPMLCICQSTSSLLLGLRTQQLLDLCQSRAPCIASAALKGHAGAGSHPRKLHLHC